MNYQDHVEAAFLDELEKIGGIGGMMSSKVLGAPLKTWGTRAAIGAVPGAILGGTFSREGEGLSGAAKGAVGGAALGMLGGGALQYRAMSKIPGVKGMGGNLNASQLRAISKVPEHRKAYLSATRSALPGVF